MHTKSVGGEFLTKLGILVVSVGVLALPAMALPTTYNFTCITNNNPGSCSAAMGQQLSVEASVKQASSPSTISFVFRNNVGIQSSITDIYFQDLGQPEYLKTLNIGAQSKGVSFSPDANPSNLPGGNGISFTATDSADSNSGKGGVMANGINSASESLEIWFELGTGRTFSQIEQALATGQLRIGLHVQGFLNGASESFVLAPPQVSPVPEPGFYGVLALGLSALYMKFRRRSA